MGKKILFLVPYPLHESPSQRFRFEQYFDLLNEKEYSYTIQAFLDTDNWKVFYSKGRIVSKCKAIAFGFAKRVIAVAKSPMYDFVFITAIALSGRRFLNGYREACARKLYMI